MKFSPNINIRGIAMNDSKNLTYFILESCEIGLSKRIPVISGNKHIAVL